MVLIVIAGLGNCRTFINACLIGHALEEKFAPHFFVKTITVNNQEKKRWISDLNTEKNWNYLRLPIIWQDLGLWGGKSILIGGFTEFYEFCYDNFGFESVAPHVDQELYYQICQERFERNTNPEDRTQQKQVRVCITNSTHPMAPELAALLLTLKALQWKEGCRITLFTNSLDMNDYNKLKCIVNDLKGIRTVSGIGSTTITTNIRMAFYKCDLIIILDGAVKKPQDSLMKWLWKNYKLMADIGHIIEEQAKPSCLIVNAAPEDSIPLCFNCQVLADFCPKIDPYSIIAITADLGFEAMKTVSKVTGVHRCDMFAPAVWGSIGINKLVDLNSCRHYYTMKCTNASYKNVLSKKGRKKRQSSSIKDKYIKEIRPMNYLIRQYDRNIFSKILNRKRNLECFTGNIPYFAKLKATVDLIAIWCDLNEHEHFTSTPVGVVSDGTYGIISYMYFSQPARLLYRTWVPSNTYNPPCDLFDMTTLLQTPLYFLRKFNLGTRFDALWLKEKKELKQIYKEIKRKKMEPVIEKWKKINEKKAKMKASADELFKCIENLVTPEQVRARQEALEKIRIIREIEDQEFRRILGIKSDHSLVTKIEEEQDQVSLDLLNPLDQNI